MEDQEIMWLRDFLKKDLPNCRTMLFGYTMDPNDVSYSVSNYVNLLLQELNKVRMQVGVLCTRICFPLISLPF